MAKKRIINDHTCVLFENALTDTLNPPSDSVEILMYDFNSKMGNIMNDIAPFKIKRATEKQKAPWKSNPTVNLLKRECRRTERKWRKSKLPSHFEINKEMLRKYNSEICKARQLFFSNIISNNINNARVIFSKVEKPTKPPPHIGPEFISTEKGNEFA